MGNWIWKSGRSSGQHITDLGTLSLWEIEAIDPGVSVVREEKNFKVGALEHANV